MRCAKPTTEPSPSQCGCRVRFRTVRTRSASRVTGGTTSGRCSPRRVVSRRAGPRPRWGVFAPLYALHDAHSTTGDLGTLGRLADWVRAARRHDRRHACRCSRRSSATATNPAIRARTRRSRAGSGTRCISILPRCSRHRSTSPRPAHSSTCPPVRLGCERRSSRSREQPNTTPNRRRWLADRPEVTEYARFRSKLEGADEAAVGYHEFVQWHCDRQLEDLAQRLDVRDQALYLDFPIGTHRAGFDVAHDPDLFVQDASVGAAAGRVLRGRAELGVPSARAGRGAPHRSCVPPSVPRRAPAVRSRAAPRPRDGSPPLVVRPGRRRRDRRRVRAVRRR